MEIEKSQSNFLILFILNKNSRFYLFIITQSLVLAPPEFGFLLSKSLCRAATDHLNEIKTFLPLSS